jgi:hypothetical protein
MGRRQDNASAEQWTRREMILGDGSDGRNTSLLVLNLERIFYLVESLRSTSFQAKHVKNETELLDSTKFLNQTPSYWHAGIDGPIINIVWPNLFAISSPMQYG